MALCSVHGETSFPTDDHLLATVVRARSELTRGEGLAFEHLFKTLTPFSIANATKVLAGLGTLCPTTCQE